MEVAMLMSFWRHSCRVIVWLAMVVGPCSSLDVCSTTNRGHMTNFVIARGVLGGRIPQLANARLPMAARSVTEENPMPAAVAFVGVITIALYTRARQSRVARQAKLYKPSWYIKETRDPLTLPRHQRDTRYGYQVLKRTMLEVRKKGEKKFWECKVSKLYPFGAEVEMVNSGLPGFVPGNKKYGVELKVGEVYMMECLACPQQRLIREHPDKEWPQIKLPHRVQPIFSHASWLRTQASIKKAQELEAGMIVDVTVKMQVNSGLIMRFDDTPAQGLLAMQDISRKMSHYNWVQKMLPPGTPMKCYVVHANKKTGRITLSTKEFEDDDHFGWMISFPERCMARAEIAVERYHEKRDRYIKYLQR